jgi:hypothetical protein
MPAGDTNIEGSSATYLHCEKEIKKNFVYSMLRLRMNLLFSKIDNQTLVSREEDIMKP